MITHLNIYTHKVKISHYKIKLFNIKTISTKLPIIPNIHSVPFRVYTLSKTYVLEQNKRFRSGLDLRMLT